SLIPLPQLPARPTPHTPHRRLPPSSHQMPTIPRLNLLAPAANLPLAHAASPLHALATHGATAPRAPHARAARAVDTCRLSPLPAVATGGDLADVRETHGRDAVIGCQNARVPA